MKTPVWFQTLIIATSALVTSFALASESCYQIAVDTQKFSQSNREVCITDGSKGLITFKEAARITRQIPFHTTGLVADCGPSCGWFQMVSDDGSTEFSLQILTGGFSSSGYQPYCNGVGDGFELGRFTMNQTKMRVLRTLPASTGSAAAAARSAECRKYDRDNAKVGLDIERSADQFIVHALSPGGPAERSGLIQAGDLIVAFTDSTGTMDLRKSSLTAEELSKKIRGVQGSRIKVVLARDGRQFSVALVRAQFRIEF